MQFLCADPGNLHKCVCVEFVCLSWFVVNYLSVCVQFLCAEPGYLPQCVLFLCLLVIVPA